MAIASSPFSPKSLMDRFRSPVFIASALSLGAHGVFFAAMPMMSASEDLQDQEESVPVVALSIEESQRLPDAVRNNRSSSLFGNDALITQDGDSLLPVPGIPPYGDLTGLDGGFNDPLQTLPPLWGNPVDIFQDSLPAIPGNTSVIFPETNNLNNFGSQPFDIPLDGSTTSTTIAANSAALTTPADVAPVIPEESENTATSEEDGPLLDDSDEVAGSGLKAPIVASEEGTTVQNAFGDEEKPALPVNPDQLASGAPETSDDSVAPEPSPASQQSRPLAGNDPAIVALRAEQQRLRDGYSNNGLGQADLGQVVADLGELGSEQGLTLKSAQSLVVQYPDPSFKCPADALPALFNLVILADGSIREPELVQSAQYLALDTAAQEAAAGLAAELTDPGLYQLSVTFQDEAGRCGNQAAVS